MDTKLRKRSPRFPSHSLEEALVYARKIYDAVHRSPIDASIAFEVMGFAGKSGASSTALGSIRQYGLIEGFSENTRISDLALQIFEPSSSFESSRALRKAGFEPKVFSDISERFSGKIPSVDEPIRAYLIRDLGFSKNGADDCISSLRRTMQFIPADGSSEGETSEIEEDAPTADRVAPDVNVSESQNTQPEFGSATHLRFPLSRDCYAELTLLGEVSPKAIKNLKRQIDLLEDFWASED